MMTASVALPSRTTTATTTTATTTTMTTTTTTSLRCGDTTLSAATPLSSSTPYDVDVDVDDPRHLIQMSVVHRNGKQNSSHDPPGRMSDEDEEADEVETLPEFEYENEDNDDENDDDNMSYDWSSVSSMEESDVNDVDRMDDEHSNTVENATTTTTTTTTNTTNTTIQQQQSTSAPPTQTPSSRPRRTVTFGMMEIYEVPSLKEYCMEDNTSFWFTPRDMITNRKAGRAATMTDPNVQNYLYYYEFLYLKLHTANVNTGSNNTATTISTNNHDVSTTDSPPTTLLSPLDQRILAYGLQHGHQGLEREGTFEESRQRERRAIVKQIVHAHRSLQQQQRQQQQQLVQDVNATSLTNDTIANENENDQNHTTPNTSSDEQLRTFALSLTRNMSYWAASLGQAAHFAAIS